MTTFTKIKKVCNIHFYEKRNVDFRNSFATCGIDNNICSSKTCIIVKQKITFELIKQICGCNFMTSICSYKKGKIKGAGKCVESNCLILNFLQNK